MENERYEQADAPHCEICGCGGANAELAVYVDHATSEYPDGIERTYIIEWIACALCASDCGFEKRPLFAAQEV